MTLKQLKHFSDILQKVLAFAFGAVFFVVLAYAALRPAAILDPGQFFFLRVIAAVSAACVGAILPGFIRADITWVGRLSLRALGCFALFSMVYLVNPPQLGVGVLTNSVRVGRPGDDDPKAVISVRLALAQGNWTAAEEASRKALERYPESSRAHFNLACALSMQAKQETVLATRDRLLDGASTAFVSALGFDVLRLLQIDEGYVDPIARVLADDHLKFLFDQRPSVKAAVEPYRSAFVPKLKTASLGKGGIGCFPDGSVVLLADRTELAIEKLKVGAEVLAWDDDLMQDRPAKVVALHHHESSCLRINGTVLVTATQVLRLSTGRWVTAGELKLGDVLWSVREGRYPIVSIEPDARTRTVFALEVEGAHSFYASGMLAHNKLIQSND